MKQKKWKKVVTMLSALAMGIMLIAGAPVDVKADNGITEAGIVETEKLVLKVGEAFGLSMENIDKLLAEAGYDYESNPSSVPKIFYGDRVQMDVAYLMPASGVGVFDVDTLETLDMLYVADEEWPALMEDVDDGTLAGKYGKEVGLVEEAEGFAYYARAEKEGNTIITIPEYPVAGGGTITVNIPVVIEAVSQEGGSEEIEVPVDTTIESTTDTSITIDNSNSVLPAGTVLESAKLESGAVYENAEKIVKEEVTGLGKYAVYELNLADGDSNEIHQLNGKIFVTMNLPFVMAENTVLKVYRVDNDVLINCPAIVSEGKVTFETDHFSTYILAEEPAPIDVPATGDTSKVPAIVLLLMAGVSLCGIAVFEKKYKRAV